MGAVMRSRVTPGVGSTMEMRRPASQLNSDDLPTLGRPTIATWGTATRISFAFLGRQRQRGIGNNPALALPAKIVSLVLQENYTGTRGSQAKKPAKSGFAGGCQG